MKSEEIKGYVFMLVFLLTNIHEMITKSDVSLLKVLSASGIMPGVLILIKETIFKFDFSNISKFILKH